MQRVEIKVRGQIDKGRADWFGGLTVNHTTRGETVLTGDIRDQAELRGMLCQLADLGLELKSLTTRPAIHVKGGD